MKQLNLFFLFLIILFLGIPFFLSSSKENRFSYEIDAPLGLVFDEFSEFKNFSNWEMFTAKDTATLKTFRATEDDKNEFIDWSSKTPNVGDGTFSLESVDINKSIDIKVVYEYWKGEDHLKFDFEPLSSGATKVNVRYITQEVPYFYRYFLLFKSPIIKIKKSVENLTKLITEKQAANKKEGKLSYGEYQVVHLNKQLLLAIKKNTTTNEKETAQKAEEAFDAIFSLVKNDENTNDYDLGFLTIYTTDVNTEENKKTFFAGVNFMENIPLKRGLQRVFVPEGDYLLTIHQGSRNSKANTIKLMNNYAKSNNLDLVKGKELEVYLNDPKETDTIRLRSRIYIPIKK